MLAEDVHAAGDVPPFACSAMDGFADQGRRRRPHAADRRRVARRDAPPTRRCATARRSASPPARRCPTGATAVIRQEDADADGGHDRDVNEAVAPGENVRDAGEDMRAGTDGAVAPGRGCGAAELGAAVAAGAGRAVASRRPRVQVLCTGDELRAPGRAARARARSTTPTPRCSSALARRLRGRRRCRPAAAATTAPPPSGRSREALEQRGRDDRLRRRLGRPARPRQAGARRARRRARCSGASRCSPASRPGSAPRGDTLVFGLPGNPVSAVVTFSLFAAPGAGRAAGRRRAAPLDAEAVLGDRRAAQPQPRAGAARPPRAPRRRHASRRPTARRARTSSPRCSAPTRSR